MKKEILSFGKRLVKFFQDFLQQDRSAQELSKSSRCSRTSDENINSTDDSLKKKDEGSSDLHPLIIYLNIDTDVMHTMLIKEMMNFLKNGEPHLVQQYINDIVNDTNINYSPKERLLWLLKFVENEDTVAEAIILRTLSTIH